MGHGAWGVGHGAWGMGRGTWRTWRTNDVGANYAGEFIRRYSPLGKLSRLHTQTLFEDDFHITIGFA